MTEQESKKLIANIKDTLPLLSAYFLLLGLFFEWGYWSYFSVDFLSFISFGDIVRLAATPLIKMAMTAGVAASLLLLLTTPLEDLFKSRAAAARVKVVAA